MLQTILCSYIVMYLPKKVFRTFWSRKTTLDDVWCDGSSIISDFINRHHTDHNDQASSIYNLYIYEYIYNSNLNNSVSLKVIIIIIYYKIFRIIPTSKVFGNCLFLAIIEFQLMRKCYLMKQQYGYNKFIIHHLSPYEINRNYLT